MRRERLVIIGSGAAGWTAAVYAARAGLNPLVIAGTQHGGQMTIAGEVENFPGFPGGVDGPALMADMERQALRFGARVAHGIVEAASSGASPFLLSCDFGEVEAEAVIVATGATARWLGIPGEKEHLGRGVSACATCDGYFYRGRDVVVVGGGNTAAEEAAYLAGLCRTVHLVHRRSTLRAERILQDRLLQLPNVRFHWDAVAVAVKGTPGPLGVVTGVEVAAVGGSKDSATLIEADGFFAAIGHDPATAPFRGWIDLDDAGYVRVAPGRTATSVDGVFAAGDVADPHYRQAVTAAGMGCMAALDAERWLASRS